MISNEHSYLSVNCTCKRETCKGTISLRFDFVNCKNTGGVVLTQNIIKVWLVQWIKLR